MSSAPARGPVVTRSYSPAPDQCTRALELLLKSVSKKAAGTSGGKDARKEVPNASGKSIIPKRR
jgi:hypothetical protein